MDIAAKSWKEKDLPKRILVIRLQALGDTVITLPYLQALRNTLPPGTKIDFLTREDNAAVPKSLDLFDHVYCIKGTRNARKRLFFTFMMTPRLLINRYQVVIDLQNNKLSRLVRYALNPRAWSEFDKFSPIAAGERTRLTIESIGLGPNHIDSKFIFKQPVEIDSVLKENGWDGNSKLAILNPAGAFITRNWRSDNYVNFAKMWINHFPDTQFVITGIDTIADKAKYIKQALGDKLIYLVGNTTQLQAFAIIQKAQFMLSEDSGLMHMAWVSNVPTIALFGSTRSDWVRPLNNHSVFLSSNDLACGNCMLATCIHGDVRCLTRYTPRFVFEKVSALLQSVNEEV